MADWIGPAIQAVGSFAGGQAASGKDRKLTQVVAEAKLAGLHPLFALGSAAGLSPQWNTGPGGAIGAALESVGRSISGISAEKEAKRAAGVEAARAGSIAEAQVHSLRASAARDEAMAAEANSAAALNSQKLLAQGNDHVQTVDADHWLPLITREKYTPSQVGGDPVPMWQPVYINDGMGGTKVIRIGNQAAGLENPETLVPAILAYESYLKATKGKGVSLSDFLKGKGSGFDHLIKYIFE